MTHPDDRNFVAGLYSWSQTFSEAVNEKDPGKLREKVAAAETAIFNRLQALTEGDAGIELMALREASRTLLSLKTRVLQFPDWRQS